MSENKNFKHIIYPGESRLESLGDPVVFYKWERNEQGVWSERFWSFELFAQTQDGERVIGLVCYIVTTWDNLHVKKSAKAR
jgi:hypothetical protein